MINEKDIGSPYLPFLVAFTTPHSGSSEKIDKRVIKIGANEPWPSVLNGDVVHPLERVKAEKCPRATFAAAS
jgi:hypothetical protein